MSFGGLYISISGIYANKKALDTVSHNISNVNNPSYTRQSAIHASSTYTKSPDGKYQLGSGVKVEEIRQIRDEFLDLKFRSELEFYGYWKANNRIYGEIESIFNEGPKDVVDEGSKNGLQNILRSLWENLDELNKEPDSLTVRSMFHESGVAFTETVNHIYTQLDNLQFNLNREIISKVEEINNILKGIADINNKIKLAEAYGHYVQANDYRDTRNQQLDRLSQLIPVRYYENNNSEIVVSLFGRSLVNGSYINPIKIEYDNRGFGNIYWSDTKDPIDLGERGELGGYIATRDKAVDEYKRRLNIMVQTLAIEVNKIHEKGTNLRGETGIKFFIPENEEEIDASNIRVNPILIDVDRIAASETGAIGDGEIAKKILEIRDKHIFLNYDEYGKDIYNDILEDTGKSIGIDEFYRDLIISIGVERNKANKIELNQGILLKQIDDRRKTISDVSLDEEMAFMLQYQHSYIANSRVINAIDEMIETIVTRTGLVGR